MNTPQPAVLKKLSVSHAGLFHSAVLAIAVFGAQIIVVLYEKYGHGTAQFALVAACLILLGCAAWFNHVLFDTRATLAPFLAASIAILAIWFWQKLAFNFLVPNGILTYGYFLTPGGLNARFWVLSCPFWLGLCCLLICCIVACVIWWRAGARALLGSIILWWLAAFIIYALPSLDLDAQGNASIFI